VPKFICFEVMLRPAIGYYKYLHGVRYVAPVSEETRLKMSGSRLGKKHKPMSEQGRRNLSESHKGYVIPDAQRKKMSLAHTGKRYSVVMRQTNKFVQYSKNYIRGCSDAVGISIGYYKYLNGLKRYVASVSDDARKKRSASRKGTIVRGGGSKKGVRKTFEHRLKIAQGVVRALQENPWNEELNYAGVFFRSSWELKVAKWLDANNVEWEYEKEIVKTPYGYYVPDFKLINVCEYMEVKGVLSGRQSEKIEWFAAHNVLHIVDKTNIGSITCTRTWVEYRTTNENARRATT
jgi:hypothetical protein